MLRTLFALAPLLAAAAAAAPAPRVDASRDPAFRPRVEEIAAGYDLLLQVDDFARVEGFETPGGPFSRIADTEGEGRAPGTCIGTLCKFARDLDCRLPPTVLRAAGACRGNAGGECLRKACGYLAEAECDKLARITPIAASCRGVNNGGCVDHVCRKLGSPACDTPGELALVLEACR